MNVSVFIARRLRFRIDGRRKSAGPAIAVAGIAVAFVVMALSLAVTRGFKDEIKNKITGFDAQVSIYPPASPVTGDTGTELTLTPALAAIIEAAVPGAKVTLKSTAPVVLKTRDDFQGMIIRTLAPADSAGFIADNLVAGAMPAGTDEVVIPAITARRLRLDAGDRLDAYFVGDNNVKARRVTVSGIYDTRFSDYDKTYMFAPAAFVNDVNAMSPDQGRSIAIEGLGDDEAVEAAKQRLDEAIRGAAVSGADVPLYQVKSIRDTGAAYFSWLSLLDTNVAVILALMAVVSAFTLVSSMFILILERVNMIGILKALGARGATVRGIFIYMAERLVVRGLLIGNVAAAALIFVQRQWHIVPLDPESYYLSYVPVEPEPWSWIALNAAVVAMAALVLIVPSHIIASIKPTSAIRYE